MKSLQSLMLKILSASRADPRIPHQSHPCTLSSNGTSLGGWRYSHYAAVEAPVALYNTFAYFESSPCTDRFIPFVPQVQSRSDAPVVSFVLVCFRVSCWFRLNQPGFLLSHAIGTSNNCK